MEQKKLNGQNSVATSADNFKKIIASIGSICPNQLKYFVKKLGYTVLDDDIYLKPVADDDRILRVVFPDGNYRNVVKNHSVGSKCNWKYVAEQVRQIMCTHYNVPNPKYFPTFNDWAEDLYEYGFCSSEKRWDKFRADYEAETAKYNA